MDFLRRMTFRHVLAVATVGCVAAGFGGACAAQDDRGAVSQAAYHGGYLSWSGKRAQTPPQDDAAASADLSEARYAPAPNYTPGGYAPQAPRNAPAPSDVSESRYGPAPSDPPPAPRYARSPSTESYAAAAATEPPPVSQPAPAPPPAPAPAPRIAAAAPPASYAQASRAAPPAEHAEGTSSVRFYSLHRAYGMTPDPIPATTEGHTVLIGPPDHAAAAQDQSQGADQDEQGGDDGKPAAHGDASGDGQSGDN